MEAVKNVLKKKTLTEEFKKEFTESLKELEKRRKKIWFHIVKARFRWGG